MVYLASKRCLPCRVCWSATDPSHMPGWHWICICSRRAWRIFRIFRSTTKLGLSNAIWTATVRRGFSIIVNCKCC